MKEFISAVQYKIIAFGGAGSEIIKKLLKSGIPPGRMLYFDTDKRSLDRNGLSNRFLLGVDHVKGLGTQGDVAMGKRIFFDHTEVFKKLTEDDCLYILVGALGGGTFSAMAPMMAEILENNKRKFIVLGKMPEDEPSNDRGNAFEALEAINAFTDKVVLLHGEMVTKYVRNLEKDDAYAQMNQLISDSIFDLLDKPGIRIIKSSSTIAMKFQDNLERIKAYIEGNSWFVAFDDTRMFVGQTNRALLDIINNNRNEIKIVSPRKFEELTAYIYQESGYETELTKATRDGGIDIKVKTLPALRGTPFLTVVQAKHRLSGTIHSYEIQQLEGARVGADAHRAALVSTAEYSKDSIKYAKGQKIDLLSFFELSDDYQRLSRI